MVPPSNDIKATYTVNLRWLSKLVVNICGFWFILIIRRQTRGKKYKKGLPIFLVQQIFSIVSLAVKSILVGLQKALEQQGNSKVISTSQFWTLECLRPGPKNLLFLVNESLWGKTSRFWLVLLQEKTGRCGDRRIDNVKKFDVNYFCLASRNSGQPTQKSNFQHFFKELTFRDRRTHTDIPFLEM